jgi:predicted DNA-binding WGR domain protein
MSEETRRIDYAHLEQIRNNRGCVRWRYEGGAECVLFDTFEAAKDAYNDLVDHGHKYGYVPAREVRADAPTLTITDNGHGQDIAPAPQWSTTQKDAVYEFARFLQTKMGLAKPRIYIGYADEFFGDKPPR